MNIYNLEKEYTQIVDQIIENDGVITPEQEQALAINKESLEIKAVKYGYAIKNIEEDVERIDQEIDRLTALKNAHKAAVINIKDVVSAAMKKYGITEIKLQDMKIYFTKSTSVEIYDESKIPDDYKITKVETNISKIGIKKDLIEGIEVPGAGMSPEKYNIQFLKLKGKR